MSALHRFRLSSRIVVAVALAAWGTVGRSMPSANAQESLPDARSIADARSDLFAKTYAAADLVLPLRKAIQVAVDKQGKTVAGAIQSEPDFSSIEELIMSRIDPPSWVAAGGDATIARFPNNLSFVVTQTEANHRRIAELFAALRRGRARTIVLETRIIVGSRSSFFNKIANLGVPVPSMRRPQPLSAHQAKLLFDAAQKDRDAKLIELPMLRLAPGQLAQFHLPAGASGQTSALLRADADAAHSQVGLTIVANAQDAVGAVRSAISITLRCDEPVLIDVTPCAVRAENSDAVPLADQLESSTAGGNDGARTLLVVTPRIVMRDPAELLGIPSTP